MPDDKMIAFLAGLRVYDDSLTVTHNERGWAIIWGSDGDSVAHVRGAPDDDMDADLAAQAIVAAAHEYAERHRSRTHSDECWRWHPECAVAMIEKWLPVIEAAERWYKTRTTIFAKTTAVTLDDAAAIMETEGALETTVAAALKEGAADE